MGKGIQVQCFLAIHSGHNPMAPVGMTQRACFGPMSLALKRERRLVLAAVLAKQCQASAPRLCQPNLAGTRMVLGVGMAGRSVFLGVGEPVGVPAQGGGEDGLQP